MKFIEAGHGVRKVLSICELHPGSIYYKSRSGGKRGRTCSQFTEKKNGQHVANEELVGEIEKLLALEFVDYGHRKVSHWLKKQGYIINHKKVYRLMKEARLLYPKRPAPKVEKQWVTQLVPEPEEIFSHLEVDIKYLHVHGQQRNAMQITVLDVMSRWVLGYYIGWGITKSEVITIFKSIFDQYPMPISVIVRCDNGSQFVAKLVRSYLASIGVTQEFTRPATPEQNGHIEGFHSIIERVIERKYRFVDLAELKATMGRFIKFYNTERIHSGIKYNSPLEFIRENDPEVIGRYLQDQTSDKALVCNQSEGLAEVGDCSEDDL